MSTFHFCYLNPLPTAPDSREARLDQLLREVVRRMSIKTDWESQDFVKRAQAALDDE